MTMLSDVRLAVRSLRRRPGYAALTVLILALGIGANTAIFSVVDAVLLRSLPYERPEEIVVLYSDGTARGQADRLGTSPADYVAWTERSDVFAGLAALRNMSYRITSVDTPVVPLVHGVTANYFDVVGARPRLGRTFAPEEDEPGRDDVVVLSYGIWQSAFGGDEEIVGRKIGLDERPHTVIGVMGPDFHTSHFIAVQPGLWVPQPIRSTQREERTVRDLLVYGRLKPGTSVDTARAAIRSVAAAIAREHPDTNDRWSVSVVPLREQAVGQFSRTGIIVLTAVGLVLLIACANVANLTLARASERSPEIAVRTVLGASRRRLVVQLVTESVLLSLAGGAVGAVFAWLGAQHIAALIPEQANVPFLDRVAVDARVLGFTFVISLLSGVVFGLVPARHATRVDLGGALRERSTTSLSGSGRRLREALVVAEVALAVVVVSSAALMLRTFAGLQQVDPGFDADRILKLRTSLRGEAFAPPAARVAHFEELKRRLEALPGVARVSAASFEPPPVGGGGAVFGAVALSLPGAAEDSAAPPTAVGRVVLPDYFETLGMPVLAGRAVGRQDVAGGQRVAAVSELFARRYFPGEDPIGRSFAVRGGTPTTLEIVGVVGDVITGGNEPAPQPAFYLPYAQTPVPVMSVLMRVPEGEPLALAREAERIAWSLSPSTNVYQIETLDRQIDELNWRTRFGAVLLGGFAALALVLGAAGIYAVVSYTVAQRNVEMGLRMALGADPTDVLKLVVTGALRPVALGVLAGCAGAVAVTRLLAGMLYGVQPGDPVTLAGVGALLMTVAAAACLGPGLRAARVDPQVALRE